MKLLTIFSLVVILQGFTLCVWQVVKLISTVSIRSKLFLQIWQYFNKYPGKPFPFSLPKKESLSTNLLCIANSASLAFVSA